MSANGSSSNWRERLASPLTWHFAGFIVLLMVATGLAVRLGMDWAAMHRDSSDVLASKQIQLKALELQTAPLRGLDKRVDQTREEMLEFYKKRIPPDYSLISSTIGDLAVASGVRLTRVQYSQGAPGVDLTEISMDAGISGEYTSIMRFVNSIERDKILFIIRAMSFTSQQGGLVNLRLRVSTWLRPEDVPSGLPSMPGAGQPAPGAAPDASAAEKEGD
jgi:type IV pilus assembly protein PilO